jgi:DNA-directed RNA polymerase subunit RPC12/RpoP
VTRPPVRDLIVPGSARLVEIREEYTLVTVRCGRCSHEQEARAESKTTRCTACGRTCRLLSALPAENVIPLRRSA